MVGVCARGHRALCSAGRSRQETRVATRPVQHTAVQRPATCHLRTGDRISVRSSSNDSIKADEPTPSASPSEQVPVEVEPRADEALPEDLADAILQAAQATAEAIKRGNMRTQVEILLPEFWDPISGPIFPNRGDQDRFWRITRRFVEQLTIASGITPSAVNAVYPDAGVAAMLSHQWSTAVDPDAEPATFRLTSLNDRRPIKLEDELVVMACPDPPGAEDTTRIVRLMGDQDEEAGTELRPVVLFNQRLSSGDVGLGLNARRMRSNFLNNFSVTYSLRPIGDIGTVYRRYPGIWQVFLQDPEMPGRFKLVTEQPSRPQGEYLDFLVQEALGKDQAEADGTQNAATGFVGTLSRTVMGLQRFMKSLAN